jgi:hypothetical protein
MALQEATFEMTSAAFSKEKEADKALYVHFYSDALPDADASDKEGRAIYRDADFVMIMVPGDKYSIIHRPVQQKDIQRFRERYNAFKAGQAQEHAAGTPLHTVPWMTKPLLKELEFLGCYTLENLAGMPDSTTQKFMTMQGLKQRAKDAIAEAKGAAPMLAMRTEIEKKDAELADLKKTQMEMMSQIQQLQNAIMNSAINQAPVPEARASRK